MKEKKLVKLKKQLEDMRKSPQGRKADEFITIAKQLGREEDPRGKEPTYVRKINPELSPPLSIPNHSGEMKTGTARSIIDALLDDVDEWKLYLAQQRDNEDENG
jgi:hypothetical protein